jgi:hypothetical protein
MLSSMNKLAIGAATAIVTLGGVGVGLAASAGAAGVHAQDEPQALVLRASLAPSLPTYAAIFGVKPGGAPWAIRSGLVRLGQGGALEVNVSGLVLTTTGANPVPGIAASVFCDGTLAATTVSEPFSTTGDARIHTSVSLPSPCLAPAVLLNPATPSGVVTSVYIGFDGTA